MEAFGLFCRNLFGICIFNIVLKIPRRLVFTVYGLGNLVRNLQGLFWVQGRYCARTKVRRIRAGEFGEHALVSPFPP